MAGRRSWMLVALAAVVGLPVGGVEAQEAGIVGTWVVEYPARVTNLNGVESVEMGRARMTLVQRGDSVTGRWLALDASPADGASRERELRGTARGTHVSLASEGKAVVNTNGEERSVPLTVTLELAVEGDTLSGTQVASSPDWPMSAPPRPVKGTREKPPAGSGA